MSLDGKDHDQDHAVLHSASSRQFPAGRFRRLGARQGFHHDMGDNQSTIGQLVSICVAFYPPSAEMYTFVPLMRNLPSDMGGGTVQDALKQSLVHRHSVHFPLLPMLHRKYRFLRDHP